MKSNLLVMVLVLTVYGSYAMSEAAVTIAVETATHHLGDDSWASIPPYAAWATPEGYEWHSQPFSIRCESATTMTISFDQVAIYQSYLVINGVSLQLPYITAIADGWQLGQKIDVDTSILRPSGNTIGFQSRWVPNGDPPSYDDFLFRNLTIQVVPEPATLSLLGLGGLLITRRRRD